MYQTVRGRLATLLLLEEEAFDDDSSDVSALPSRSSWQIDFFIFLGEGFIQADLLAHSTPKSCMQPTRPLRRLTLRRKGSKKREKGRRTFI